MIEMMVDLATYSEEARQYPLLQERDECSTVAVVAMTGDRGLAGAFNANVVRKALAIERDAARRRASRRACSPSAARASARCSSAAAELEQSWQGLSDRPAVHRRQGDRRASSSTLLH